MVRRLRTYSPVQELGGIALGMTCFRLARGQGVRFGLLRLQLGFPCSQHFGRI